MFFPEPNDTTRLVNSTNSGSPASDFSSDVANFAAAMRLSEPPPRQTSRFTSASLSHGAAVFDAIGCNLCHSDSTVLQTVAQTSLPSNQGAKVVPIFSDLALHHMGVNLQDKIVQGLAGPDQFRSAPLWGLASRIFLLHDGRTQGLVDAIEQHQSSGSEANQVISNFNMLDPQSQQDLINYLRSL